MNFKTKFSAVILIALALLSLTVAWILSPTTGKTERGIVATSQYSRFLNVGDCYSFPKLQPLGKSVGESDLYAWSVHNDEYIKFVFQSGMFDTKAVGVRPWERDSVEVYISNADNPNTFYQIIIPISGNVTYLKYEGGNWTDKNPEGYTVIKKDSQWEVKWNGVEEIDVSINENVVSVEIPFSIAAIPMDKMIIQIIHNVDGGKNRFVSSLHPVTKNEQDRRGWTKLQTDK
jgi:hypothetical protein